MADAIGSDALQAIDKLLSDRPHKVGHDFSEATRRLTAWRQGLIARWRQTQAEADRHRLAQVNAAISVIVGGQFPLGSIPWAEIEQTRQAVATLVASDDE